MKNRILGALKAKFEGVGDAILSRIAEKLVRTVTNEDAVQGAVDAVTFQQIIDGEADRRATEATQSAVSNYEKKHSLKEGKPVAGGAQENKTATTTGGEITAETIAAAVAAAVKPLADEINALKIGKVSEGRKLRLEAVIDKLPDSLKKTYGRVALKDMTDDEFEAFISETTSDVEAMVADAATKGAVMKTPMGGGKTAGKEPSKEDAAEVIGGMV